MNNNNNIKNTTILSPNLTSSTIHSETTTVYNDDENDNHHQQQQQQQLSQEPLLNSSSPILKDSDNEDKCSICLGEIDDLTFLDICFHHFCYHCILQWSDLSLKCPLCKCDFLSLIYQVKSNRDYKRHILTNNNNNNTSTNQNNNDYYTQHNHNNNNDRNRRNHFINERRNNRQQHQQQQQQQQQQLQYQYPQQQQQRGVYYLPTYRGRGDDDGIEFRRSVYANESKAIPMVPPFKLYISPSMIDGSIQYWKKRLTPWIKRELQSILQTECVDVLEELVWSLLRRYDIKSQELTGTISRFLYSKTDLFIHELLCFASSNLNIQTYDKKVKYLNNNINYNERDEYNEDHGITTTSTTTTQTKKLKRKDIDPKDIIVIEDSGDDDDDEQRQQEPLTNFIKQSINHHRYVPTILTEIMNDSKKEQQQEQLHKKIKYQLQRYDGICKEPDWDRIKNDNEALQDTIYRLQHSISKLGSFVHDIHQQLNSDNKD